MSESEILQLLEDALTGLEANKPMKDAKRSSAYAITIMQLKLALAHFQVYAMEYATIDDGGHDA